MKKLSLRPYPGIIKVCSTRKEYCAAYKKLFKEDIDLKGKCGRMDGKMCDKTAKPTYLVWAVDTPRLAHELAHVIFSIFEIVKVPITRENDEAFCYMLSQLLLDAA